MNGTRLSASEFYDPSEDILISVSLTDVTTKALSALNADHRLKLQKYISNEMLVLARRYATDGSSKLRVVTSVPLDSKYRDVEINARFKGKKGQDIGNVLLPSTLRPRRLMKRAGSVRRWKPKRSLKST